MESGPEVPLAAADREPTGHEEQGDKEAQPWTPHSADLDPEGRA